MGGHLSPRRLTAQQIDRVAGVLLGTAIGDALGVPYEFGLLLPEDEMPEMTGGGLGPYGPGEYSDDTQMAVCVARGLAVHSCGREPRRTLDAVAAGFLRWSSDGASDMGNLTRRVLDEAGALAGPPSLRCATAARRVYERSRSAFGNGALMRTAPVGLVALSYRDARRGRRATARAARAVAELTHADPRAGDACVLWSEAVRVAVLEGRFDVAAGLDLVPESREAAGDEQQPPDPRAWWAAEIEEASAAEWRDYRGKRNGATHASLKVAWACIRSAAAEDEAGGATGHIRNALEAAVRVGHDTDTVAAIAGGLLGARYGASAFPAEWVSAVRGWSGLRDRRVLRAADLERLGVLAAHASTSEAGAGALLEALAQVSP